MTPLALLHLYLSSQSKKVLRLVALTVTLVSSLTAQTYYVSPSGSDTNNGTSTATPWGSISKVNSFVFPQGATVSFQGGQTFTGCLTFNTTNVPTSSASTPFTVKSYGTGVATIQSNCSGTTGAAVTVDNVSGFTFDGLKVANGSTTIYGILLENQTSNSPTQTIVIKNSEITGFGPVSGSSNGGEIWIIGYALNGNNGPLNNIQILNNNLHGASVTSGDGGGVNGWGYGKNITNVLVQGNTVYNMGMVASTTWAGIDANGWNGGTIQYNILHDLGANVTSCGGTSGIETYTSNNITIRYNEIYNVQPSPSYTAGCDWDGIDLDGGTTNSLVEYNYTHHNAGSGYLAYTLKPSGYTWGPNTYRYNISENDDWSKAQGALFDVVPQAPANALQIYGNTFYSNVSQNTKSTSSACFNFGNGSGTWGSGSLIADNICYMTNYDKYGRSGNFYYNPYGQSGMTLSNNLYYANSSPTWRWSGTNYTSLSAWQETGLESNSAYGDPLFTSGGTGGTCSWTPSLGNGPQTCPAGYALQTGSPGAGTGIVVEGNGGKDYYQSTLTSPPSIGAYSGTGGGSVPGGTTPPGTPTGLSATATSVSMVDLTWTVSTNAWSYNIYRSLASGFTPSPSNLVAQGIAGSPYSDSGLTNGTTYYYVVQAVNGAGTSSQSNQASATTFSQAQLQYYVSPDGNDSNDGVSAATPWQTIAKVNSFTYPEGATVSFQGGQTFSGCLNFTSTIVPRSSPQNPFTVTSYGGGTATIQSTTSCTGKNTAAIIGDNINGFTVDGLKVVNGASTNWGVLLQNSTMTYATQGMTVKNSEITGFATTGGQNGGEVWILGYALNGNNGPLNGVQILNNSLHGATATSVDGAAVGGYGYGKNITNVLIEGNTADNLGNPAPYAALNANGMNGAIIQYNVVHDIGANTTTCGGTSGIQSYNANSVYIQYNEVYNVQPLPSFTEGCDWDGIDLDGGTTNSIVQYNYTHHNAGAGMLAYTSNPSGTTWGPNTYRYNISENDDLARGVGGLFGITPNPAPNPIYVYGNTFLNNISQSSTSSDPSACLYLAMWNGSGAFASGSMFEDNICYMANSNSVGSTEFVRDLNTMTGLTFNHNLYYTPNTPQWIWNGTTYTTLTSWNESGIESSAVGGDPLLNSAGNGGTCVWTPSLGSSPQPCPTAYTLETGSPAVAAGVAVSNNGGVDYYQTTLTSPPNIGAYSGSGVCRSGLWCLKATLPATANYTSTHEQVTVSAGQAYTGSIYIRGSGAVELDVMNDSTYLATVKCTATSTWAKCSTPSFSTGSYTSLRFQVKDSYAGAGTLFIDDCLMGGSDGTNVLVNPGFESGATSWEVDSGGASTWVITQF